MKKRLLISLLSFTLCLTPLTPWAAETVSSESLNDETCPVETVCETVLAELPETVLSNELSEAEPSAPVYTNKGVHDYIVRLYETILDRSADGIGLDDWYQRLISGKNTGANVAYGFFFSQEYTSKNTDNDTYLKDLYKALFDRAPDNAGYSDWYEKLEAGVPRVNIFKGFVDSQEFGNLCKRYNIEKGTVEADASGYTNYYTDQFVRRLYATVLGREADKTGLDSWKSGLINQKTTGAEVAHGFIFSPECLNKNLSDSDFVDLLYKSLFGRNADSTGKTTWLQLLNEGNSREYIFAGFVNSAEFANLCSLYGIKKGTWSARGIDPNKPMIALTFDDGPSYYTPRILDALEKHGQAATFFVVGYNAARYGETMKRAYDMGCEIGNHSYNHPDLTYKSYSGIVSEMTSTNALIYNATGANATICRTPGGSVNSTVRSAVGMPIIMWSIDTIDWKTRDTWSTVNIVLNNVRDGDIILMHDIHAPTISAAEILIPELVARGYQLVTVSELAQYKGVQMQNGEVYRSFR